MERISLTEVLKFMSSGKSFSIKFVTYDRKRKKGGEIRSFSEAKLVQKQVDSPKKQNNLPDNREVLTETKHISKNPNHYSNATRNIAVLCDGLETGVIRKVHIFLITEFNGLTMHL